MSSSLPTGVRRLWAGLMCLALLMLATGAAAEPRVALVVGNSNYGGDLGILKNPVNDAKLIADTLRKVGFEVIEAEDADLTTMKRALSQFGAKLSAAGDGATGLFFFAGHGLQVGGTNYLVPVHAEIKREADVDLEAISADLVMKQMAFAESAVNIVILDACRNNPLTRGFRDVTNGLAEIRVKPRGAFISYSTAPGDVAADGAGDNSPYSAALATEMAKPGASINDVFQAVRGDVMKATDARQVPWDSSSLTAPFYFAAAPEAAAKQPAAGDPALEIAFWNSIKDSTNPKDYEAYLKKFPNGTFADLAANKVDALKAAAPAAQTAAATTETATQQATQPAQEQGTSTALVTQPEQPLVGQRSTGQPPPEEPTTQQPESGASDGGLFAQTRRIGGVDVTAGAPSRDDAGNIVLHFTATDVLSIPMYVRTMGIGNVATTDRGGFTDSIRWDGLVVCHDLSNCGEMPEDWTVVRPGAPIHFSATLEEVDAHDVTAVNLSAFIDAGDDHDPQRIPTLLSFPLFLAIPLDAGAAGKQAISSRTVGDIRYDIVQAQAGKPSEPLVLVMSNLTDQFVLVRLLDRPRIVETGARKRNVKFGFYALSVCDMPSPTLAGCATVDDKPVWALLAPHGLLGVPFNLRAASPPFESVDLTLRVIRRVVATGSDPAPKPTVSTVGFTGLKLAP